ncbi:MAG TPA: hypothetical protein VGL62_05820 [Vicinamibacterales bacterium]|jgi:hypothetical protein
MFRKLLETAEIDVDGRAYQAHYFEHKTARGARRYSCEVVLDRADRVILDDDSVSSLQAKVACLAPATIYSRALACGRSAAA